MGILDSVGGTLQGALQSYLAQPSWLQQAAQIKAGEDWHTLRPSDEHINFATNMVGPTASTVKGVLGDVRPHWFSKISEDPYVYHGTQATNLPGIQSEGLQSFRRNYYGEDPLLAMQYGYRGGLHHGTEGEKLPGALLRALKSDVDPELAKMGTKQDFWTDTGSMAPNQLQIRQNGQWMPLVNGPK